MLKASSPGSGDNFGRSVGISGSTAIVGAYSEDTIQPGSGASYIFVINCPPVISPNTISRQQAAPAANFTLATVVDDLTLGQ